MRRLAGERSGLIRHRDPERKRGRGASGDEERRPMIPGLLRRFTPRNDNYVKRRGL